MQQDTIAENILSRFDRWILTPLQADVQDHNRSHALIFIAISVAIDNLAGIRYMGEIPNRERGCVGKRYRKFIENYLPTPYKAHAEVLYKGFRCGLVHEFQLDGIDIQQDEAARKKHLKTVEGGSLCLHSGEFLSGLLDAFAKLKSDMTGPSAKPDVVSAFEKSGYKRWKHASQPN